MFKKHNFKTFRCSPNDLSLNFYKLVGKIYLYMSKLCKKTTTVNSMIHKIAEDFENIVAVKKSKELKLCVKNV